MTNLTEDGHARIGVRATSTCTEIIIRSKRTHDALDEKGRQSRDPTSVVQKRFGFPGNSVKHFAQKPRTVLVARHRHSLPNQTFIGVAVHRTRHGVVGFTLNDGTKDGEL